MESLLKKSNKKNLQLAKELTVRELEQIKKGHFIAFVDDKQDCFDLKVVVKQEILQEISCDCQSELSPCIHVLAVVLAIKDQFIKSKKGAGKTPLKKTTTKTKKLSEVQLVLQELDKTTLDSWVLEVFKKNKPLEQQFLLSFSKKEQTYNAQQVIELTNKIIDSVAGKRKTLEAMKIKKIIDLLKIAIAPIDTFVAMHIDSLVAFEIFTAFLNTIYQFDKRIVHHSKRLGIFVDDYIEKYALTVNHIKMVETWQNQIKMYIETLFQSSRSKVEFHYILIQQLYFQASGDQQLYFAKYLGQKLQEQANVQKSKRIYFTYTFTTFLKQVCKEHDQQKVAQEFFDQQYRF
ncbi:SWIM zinc finger family protein [Myroides sp. LJL119]